MTLFVIFILGIVVGAAIALPIAFEKGREQEGRERNVTDLFREQFMQPAKTRSTGATQ